MTTRHESGLSLPAATLSGAVLGAALGALHLLPALAGDFAVVLAAPRLVVTVGLLAGLYLLWCRVSGWRALATGFAAGLGYFGVALHWLGSSANPDPATFIVREVVLTAGALWLFVPWWTLWFGIAPALRRRTGSGLPAALGFAAVFSAANIGLGDLVLGIPMAPLSVAVLDTPAMPLLRILGQFGVDALLVLAAAILGEVVLRSRRVAALAMATAALAAFAYTPAPRAAPAEPQGALVYLVQPSLPHVSMIQPDEVLAVVHGAMEEAIRDGVAAGARLVVLPEGAVLADLTADPALVSRLAALLPPDGALVAGFSRAESRTASDGSFSVRPYNSAAVIDAGGLASVIDKAHLVPFGETMPEVFFRLGFDVVAGPAGGYGHGPRIGVVDSVKGFTPFALLICYEAMVSGAVSREAAGAHWFLNISAETLFRGTVGPRLVLDQARMRAVESGLPMLRATGHAYSGVIGPDGGVSQVLVPEHQGGVAVRVPAAMPTPFSRWGYLPLHVATIAALAGAIGAGAVTRRQRQRQLAFEQ
jgi:apolipoprotein N-acyltransferase